MLSCIPQYLKERQLTVSSPGQETVQGSKTSGEFLHLCDVPWWLHIQDGPNLLGLALIPLLETMYPRNLPDPTPRGCSQSRRRATDGVTTSKESGAGEGALARLPGSEFGLII